MTLPHQTTQLLAHYKAQKIQPLGRIFFFFLCLIFCVKQTWAQDFKFYIEYKKGKAGIVYAQKDKYGYYSSEKWILEPGYDSIRIAGEFIEHNRYKEEKYKDSVCNFFLLFKKGKAGLFTTARSKDGDYFRYKLVKDTRKNANSTFVTEHLIEINTGLPCNYTEVKYLGEALFSIRVNEKLKVFNGFTAQWTASEFDEIVLQGSDLSYARKNGKLGIYSAKEGEWILKPEYDFITNLDNPSLKYSTGLFLVGSGGKMGVFSYNSSRFGSWEIPANTYDKIYPTNPQSSFFLTDSLGKSGVWQYEGNRIWQMADASFMNIKYVHTSGLVHLEKNGLKNVLSQNGWLSRNKGADNNYSKTLSVYRTNVTAEYYKGKGFELTSDCKPTIVTISIPDKTLYDSVAFDGSLLYGYQNNKLSIHAIHYDLPSFPGYFEFTRDEKNNKYDNALIPLSAQLLFEAADSCLPFYKMEDFENLRNFRSLSLLYKKNNKWKLWALKNAANAKINAVQSAFSFDKWLPTMGHGLMMISDNAKWGIIDFNGDLVIQMEHPSYKMIDNSTLLLQSPQKDQWQYFTFKDGKVRRFLHDNKIRVDFNSREMDGAIEVLTIDGKKYFLHNGYTKTAGIDWYTSPSASNTGVTKDVIGEFSSFQTKYFIRRTITGVGLSSQAREILPPYLGSISTDYDREDLNHSFLKLILTGTKASQKVSLKVNDLEKNFNSADFIAWVDKSICKECNGRGGEYVTSTKTITGKTKITTTEKTNYKTSSERVWDSRTNSYKDVQTIKPTTSYDVKTEKTADRKVTSTGYSACSYCEGRGYHKNVKYRCKIGTQGLEFGEMIVEGKKKK